MQSYEAGTIKTFRLDNKIIETSYTGKMAPEMLVQLRKDMETLMRLQPGSSWLADTTAATGYSPASRELTQPILDVFQKNSGKKIAVIMPSSGLRMLVSAVAFASGLPIKLFAKREEALVWLRQET